MNLYYAGASSGGGWHREVIMENQIRQLREEFHMTQVRLSIELGVSQETVSAYENQKHYPSFLQLQKMSSIFHASIDYIMGLSEVRSPAPPRETGGLSALVDLGRQLTPRQLELALAYMRGMLDDSAP